MAEKIVLYSVVTGNYDNVPPLHKSLAHDVDCYLGTDNPDTELPPDSAWKLKVVPKEDNAHRHQRRLKLRFHDLFPDADTVVYLDANLHLTKAIRHILPLHKGGLTTGAHPNRICTYQEAEACERLNKAPAAEIRAQMERYRKAGFPPNRGMVQTGFMIRSNTPEVRAFCEEWFGELSRGTHRDQLSVMFAAEKTGFKILQVAWPTVQRFTRLVKHAKNSRQYANIWYSTPYATDGNIGRALNEFCETVPGEQDWICLTDADALFPTPDYGRHIADVLKEHGDRYQVYGAMTNRIKSEHQRVHGLFDEMDFRKLVQAGYDLEREKWGQAHDGGSGVAGFFLCFRKSTWKKTPFRERDKTFDTQFCKDVRRAGGKIGIMSGLMLVHVYRILSPSPLTDVKHLDIVGRR